MSEIEISVLNSTIEIIEQFLDLPPIQRSCIAMEFKMGGALSRLKELQGRP